MILLSLVASDRMRPSAVNWLSREVNLWNVAITRARSHLIVFGDRDFWSVRPGMPHALLDAAEAKDGLPSLGVHPEHSDEDVGDRLQYLLTDEIPGVLIDRNATVDGYPYDFDVRRSSESVRIRLDHGASTGGEAARHLRLALGRTALLPNGVRIPAWQVWDGRTERVVGLLTTEMRRRGGQRCRTHRDEREARYDCDSRSLSLSSDRGISVSRPARRRPLRRHAVRASPTIGFFASARSSPCRTQQRSAAPTRQASSSSSTSRPP